MISRIIFFFVFSLSTFSTIEAQVIDEYRDTINGVVFTCKYAKDSLFGYSVNMFVDSHLIKSTFVDTFHYERAFNNIGPVIGYNKKGNITYVGQYDANSYSTGTWLFFHDDGSIYMELNYDRNIKNGWSKEYYKGRVLKATGRYNNPESGYTRYNYESKVGEWKYYYPSGNLERKEQYWEGEPIKVEVVTDWSNMDSLDFDAAAELSDVYQKSVKHGRWEYYNESGIMIRVQYYEKGTLIMESGVRPQEPDDQ